MNPVRLITNLLVFTSGQEGPIEKDDLISKIFPSTPWDVVIQLSAFVILLLIVFFVGYKPVKKLLAERKSYVEGQIKDAEESNRIAKEAAEKKDDVIAEGRAEAARIIEDARAQANLEANAIVSSAKEEAIRRRVEADKEIEEAKAASIEEVKESIVDVAIAASSQVLEREVSKEDNERLIKDFVSDINGDSDKR
ncbi:MAG: F0F1 ATP synthase subunit B [Bacilli bacterium]|nr:F0F1 ATP synthase subunit B [Bacilli bacterium]MBQ4255721.1 F0F1 ATP synthase subunit B [Bacilli bacterium]